MHPDSTNQRRFPLAELVSLTFARLILNTAFRMVYPFLPEISRGMGITTDRARLLLGTRSAAGFAGPLLGPLSDRFGRKAIALLSLCLLSLALATIFLIPRFGVVLAAFALLGLVKILFDPTAQAYASDRVPYAQRGRAIGILELAWSGALLIGAPLAGLLIREAGWSSPYMWLALLSLVGLGGVALVIRDGGRGNTGITSPLKAIILLLGERAALGVLAYTFFLSISNEILLAVYGEWMEGSFGLKVAALGLATAVIGGAELCGEVIVGTLSDRLGKRRLVIISMLLLTVASAALPFTVHLGLGAALVGLFVVFISFETSYVASISLASEVLPAARATMMSVNLTAASAGRVLGIMLGGMLWKLGGFTLNGLAGGLLTLVALWFIWALVAERAPTTEASYAD